VGFVMLLDWANHFEPRANEFGLGTLLGAAGLLSVAWISALLAGRVDNRLAGKRRESLEKLCAEP